MSLELISQTNNSRTGYSNPQNVIFNNLTSVSNTFGTGTFSNGIILSNSTSGYTPSLLNYFEDKVPITINLTGPASIAMPAIISRIGSNVTMFMSGVNTSLAGSGTFITGPNQIPARFKPATNQSFPCLIQTPINYPNGGIGYFLVTSSGGMDIFADAQNNNFQAGSTTIIEPISVSWLAGV
jgi:hypothetical protein